MAKVAETTSNVRLVKAMVEPAERAEKIEAKYDDAGPLRFLGKVYLTAPAWPVSVGNPDKAIEMLERAVKLASVPLNRIFLGQAYYHDEEYELAEKQLRRALVDGRAKRLTERWRKEAREYLNRIAAGATSDPRNL
jgi:tetratricopeptide (TPR) repeat protein